MFGKFGEGHFKASCNFGDFGSFGIARSWFVQMIYPPLVKLTKLAKFAPNPPKLDLRKY